MKKRRLHEAVGFLRKARKDVDQDEDRVFADGLKDRASKHISETIRATEKAIRS
jgi:hypothetical protein